MEIEITQKDIDRGLGNHADKCPIALAIRRRFHTTQVSVLGPDISIKGRWYLSRKADSFIDKFDTNQKVKPTTIRLKLAK